MGRLKDVGLVSQADKDDVGGSGSREVGTVAVGLGARRLDRLMNCITAKEKQTKWLTVLLLNGRIVQLQHIRMYCVCVSVGSTNAQSG